MDAKVTVTVTATLAATLSLNGDRREGLFHQAVEQAATVRLSPPGR